MDIKNPYAVVLIIQLMYTGMYVVSKAAFNEGFSTYIFIFYRQAAATILLAPLAFAFERKSAASLSFKVLLKMFILALVGITFSLNLYNVGLRYTSATVASAVTNSVPVITFFLALLLRIAACVMHSHIILPLETKKLAHTIPELYAEIDDQLRAVWHLHSRMESVRLKSISGIAKILGVAICLAGVVTIAFYRGPHLNPLNQHHHLFSHKNNSNHHTQIHSKTTWIKGTFLMITANTFWSLWLVLQGILLKEFSSKLLLTTFQCFFSTIQSFVVALAFEREVSRWCLSMDLGLLAIAYCGFVVTGVTFYLQTWCIEKKGPVFLAMTTPLAFVFTTICSSFFLGEATFLGSVIGGVLMVGGLYGVLWGKSKENVKCEPTIEDGKEIYEEKELSSPYRPL